MTQVFVVACNGCRTEGRPPDYMHTAEGWHLYETRDLYGSTGRVDICPDCYDSVPLSGLLAPALEAKIDEPGQPGT